MPVRNIRQRPVAVTKTVTNLDNKYVIRTIRDLMDTINTRPDVTLLSANHIGINLSTFIALLKNPGKNENGEDVYKYVLQVFHNPLLLESSEEVADGWEGCVSSFDTAYRVERSIWIKVGYNNDLGEWKIKEYTNENARSILRGLDYLDGLMPCDLAKDVGSWNSILAARMQEIEAHRQKLAIEEAVAAGMANEAVAEVDTEETEEG